MTSKTKEQTVVSRDGTRTTGGRIGEVSMTKPAVAKHTAGPWVVLDTRGTLMIGATTTEGDDVWLAEVISVDENGDLPEQANARLIAAAPDLLAALIKAEHYLAWANEHGGLGKRNVGALEQARAALAKAGAK